jgi:hypothetical protein
VSRSNIFESIFCVKVGENFNKHKINIKTGELCSIWLLCCGNVVNSADRCRVCHISMQSSHRGLCLGRAGGVSGMTAVIGRVLGQ